MARTSTATKRSEPPAAAIARGIEIHPVVLVELEKLNPAPYNPRRIKGSKLAALKQKIREVGFLDPLVIQRKGMVIIGGHQRVRAVREIYAEENRPLPKLPCVLLDIDDRAARLLNVALNNIGGEFDTSLLGRMLQDLDHEHKLGDADLMGMGLTHDEFADLLRVAEPELHVPDPDDDLHEFARSATLSLKFMDITRRDAVKKLLEERARLEGRTSGDLVFELLGGRVG